MKEEQQKETKLNKTKQKSYKKINKIFKKSPCIILQHLIWGYKKFKKPKKNSKTMQFYFKRRC